MKMFCLGTVPPGSWRACCGVFPFAFLNSLSSIRSVTSEALTLKHRKWARFLGLSVASVASLCLGAFLSFEAAMQQGPASEVAADRGSAQAPPLRCPPLLRRKSSPPRRPTQRSNRIQSRANPRRLSRPSRRLRRLSRPSRRLRRLSRPCRRLRRLSRPCRRLRRLSRPCRRLRRLSRPCRRLRRLSRPSRILRVRAARSSRVSNPTRRRSFPRRRR